MLLRKSWLVLVLLLCSFLAVVPEVRAQGVVSLVPRAGEMRLFGTLSEVSRKKGYCTLLAVQILMPDGTDKMLPKPKPKTILVGAGTTFAALGSPDNPAPVLDEAEVLKKGASVFILGRNGANGVVTSRLICALNPEGPAPVVEEVREPSEPAGKNLLLPTDRLESWGWTTISPGEATLEPQDGQIKVTVTGAGREDWRVQLAQSVVFPEPGVSYTLSFRARAEPARRLRVSAQALESDFHDIGINRTASLDSEWKQFEYTFTARNLGKKGHTLPVFFFGSEKGTTWLADVTVAVSYPEKRGNLLDAISNPSAWKLVPLTKEGGATLQITGDKLEVSTSAVSKQALATAYHLLPSSPAPLIPGRSYVLTFQGRSGEERTLRIRGIVEPVKLVSGEQAYEVKFKVNRLTDFGVSPTFVFGEQLGTFSLSNIVLREDSSGGKGKPK